MTFDWHMLYPLHTVILDNSQVFGGVPCKAQLCNFSKWFFSPRFGVVPIWELWQFCYVRIEPPKTSGKLQVHVPVWEKLLQEMATPGREVRWEHVPAHVNVQGNEVANGLAMEGMCSSPLWSQHVAPNSSSGSESTVGLRGGSGSESEGTRALWSSLGMVPMDSDELTGEASGEPAPREMGPYSSSSTESEEMRTGHTHQGVLSSALSAADTLSFSTDVSDTRRQRKKRRLRKRRNPGQGR